VVIGDGEVGDVSVDGRPVPVSARRIEQATLAGSGAARGPGEDGAPHDLVARRLEELDPSSAVRLVGCVVDTALRGDMAGLIRAERDAVARGLLEGRDTAPSRLEDLAEAVALAAEFGVVPGPRADPTSLLRLGAGDGPDLLAEGLTTGWLANAPPQPTIEAHPATLRRLTTGERPLRRDHMANADPGPRGLMNDLFLDYGVLVPGVALRTADLPDSVVRFRFGSCRTAAYLVPDDSQAVLTMDPVLLPPDSGARPFLDPAYGERWSLVDLPVDPSWPPASQLDPAAVVIRALLAEMKTRLGLWSPTWDQLPAFNWPWLDRDRLHLDEAEAALRWLLSAQASVHMLARLTEAVIVAAAEEIRGPEAIARRLRSILGKSVLGPLASSPEYRLLWVGEAIASEAVDRRSASPVLEEFKELTRATEQVVVSCPGRWRRELQCLLRPLSDTVLVAADEELAQLPVAAG
jgi:hypothetical protein